MPGRVICGAIVVSLALLARAALAQDVTVEGNRFLRDGEPWVAEGVTLVGLVSPEAGGSNKPNYAAARAAFGPGMLGEVRRFGADLVRFQVSQGGLDPKSQDHDPAYRDEVLDAVALTRAGRPQRHRLDAVAGTAGRATRGPADRVDPARLARRIAAALGDDRGILLEIFNEPHVNPRPRPSGSLGRGSMQGTIDALRGRGLGERAAGRRHRSSRATSPGAPPLDDPLGQLGYAVHPYLGRHDQTRAQWEKKWGGFARTHPVMATEWNAHSGGNYCRPEMAAQAEALLDYLAEQRIGLVAWALDLPSLMRAGRQLHHARRPRLRRAPRRRPRRRRADDPRALPGALSP